MVTPTKAEILVEINAQLLDATVPQEVKDFLQELVADDIFDDKQTKIDKAWAALKTRKLDPQGTRKALSILRREIKM